MTWKKPHSRSRHLSFKIRSSSSRTRIEDIARNEFRRMPPQIANGFVFSDGLAIIPHPKLWPICDSSMDHGAFARWILSQVGIKNTEILRSSEAIRLFMDESKAMRVTVGHTKEPGIIVEAVPPITPQQIEYIRKSSKSTDADLVVWEIHDLTGDINGEGRYLEFMHVFHQNHWGDQP